MKYIFTPLLWQLSLFTMIFLLPTGDISAQPTFQVSIKEGSNTITNVISEQVPTRFGRYIIFLALIERGGKPHVSYSALRDYPHEKLFPDLSYGHEELPVSDPHERAFHFFNPDNSISKTLHFFGGITNEFTVTANLTIKQLTS